MIWAFASSAAGLALMGWWLLRPRAEKPETVEDMIAATITERIISNPEEWAWSNRADLFGGYQNDAINSAIGFGFDDAISLSVEGKHLHLSGRARRELRAAVKALKKWAEAQELLNVARKFSERVEKAA